MAQSGKLRALLRCSALAAASALLWLTGCVVGYRNLHPGEDSAFYYPLFADLITTYDEPTWLWIRGVLALDINGDGTIKEEAVIATIQKGYQSDPGPIISAFLVICEQNAAGERVAIARTMLFQGNPIPDAPRTFNDIGIPAITPLTRARAQVIQDKQTFSESLAVYFWGEEQPTNAWYAVYSLENGMLRKKLEVASYQNSPGVLVANIDRSLENRHLGYQLIIESAAIPERIKDTIGKEYDAPQWGHVFAGSEEGGYNQADLRYGQYYRRILAAWNQYYLRAVMTGLPPEDLAWLEYHLAIINFYTGNRDMASTFLAKAKGAAQDEQLIDALGKTEAFIQANHDAMPAELGH